MKLPTQSTFLHELADALVTPLRIFYILFAAWILLLTVFWSGFRLDTTNETLIDYLVNFPRATWFVFISIVVGYWHFSIPISALTILIIWSKYHKKASENTAEQDAAANP